MKLKQLNIFTITATEDTQIQNNKIDYLEECIGAIGPWQVRVSSTAVMTRYIAMGNLLAIVFLAPATDFTCVEFKDNVTIQVENNTCYDNCSKYVYHSDFMKTSLISDFDLICEREWLASFTQTVLMFGVVVGVSIFGWISDRYGRRIALILCTVLNIALMISNSFAPSYWIFNSLRVIIGIAAGGSLIVGMIIMMEVVGKRYRETAGALSLLTDVLGQVSLALHAYLLPDWRTYSCVYGLVCTVILILICFVPESPRWLVSQGKIDQALLIIHRAAKFNKLETEHVKGVMLRHVESLRNVTVTKSTASYYDFFKIKNLRSITLSTLIIWAVIGTTYYGIYQYTTFLSSNIYITVVVLGLIQIPLCYLQIILAKSFNRRTSMIITLVTTGMSMFGIIFTPTGHWSSTILGIIGFSASVTTYTVTYIYQSELYPTPLRNMSFGLGSAVSKIGAMVAPFIVILSPTWIPSLIFFLLSIIAVGFCFLMPETKGKNLKDTID